MEEKRREQKRDAGEPFLFYCVCVFWFVEKRESTPTSLHYLPRSRDTYERGALFRRVFFCYHYLLGVFGELAIYLFQTYTGRKKAVSFSSRAFSHHVRARGV